MTSTITDGALAPSGFSCANVGVEFKRGHERRLVLDGLNFEIGDGEFVSLLGGSGVGKTTLLRILGGLQAPTSASQVRYAGKVVDGPPDRVVTVFQDYTSSLLAWRTVEKNVSLGLEGRVSDTERKARIDQALGMVGLTAARRDYPWQLSGGMQQRVQIARALVMQPRALLMDEPFGSLDAMTKGLLQDGLLDIHHRTNTTIVFVTHDIDEAVYLSDRIFVLTASPVGPACIGKEVVVDLPRPRNQVTTKEDSRYLQLRHSVYDAIGKLHGADS
jgi:NitT/TauT family transport system ATP-binding protein